MNSLIKSLFFLFLFSSCFVFSQSKNNVVDSQGLKQGLWEEIFDSTSNSRKQIVYLERANYLNDTLHGNYLILENSKISYEAEYFKGKLIGFERYYSEIGSLERIIHRQGDTIDFDLKFYSNGKPKNETYFSKGKLTSIKDYYSNGVLRSISYYIDNELDGNEYYYKKNGKLRMIMEYQKGKFIGLVE